MRVGRCLLQDDLADSAAVFRTPGSEHRGRIQPSVLALLLCQHGQVLRRRSIRLVAGSTEPPRKPLPDNAQQGVHEIEWIEPTI